MHNYALNTGENEGSTTPVINMPTYRAIVNFHGNMLHTLYQGQLDDSKNKKSVYDNIATYTQSQFRNLKAKSMHIIHHAVIRWFLQ